MVAHVRTIATLALLLTVCACSPDDGQETTTGCAATVRDASFATEVAEQVALLDDALVRCGSLGELAAEMGRYPGIIGYEIDTFVELRCTKSTDDAVRRSPSCTALVAPPSTPPPTATELVFVGETLDGRRVEIRPDADTQFAGDVPATVQQTVDIAVEAGCEGVLAQRDLWAQQAAQLTGDAADEASVYAQHAQRVADYIGCAPATTTEPGAPPSSTTP